MSIAGFASVIVQVAPFIAIIAIEIVGQGFDRRLEGTVRQYERELASSPLGHEEFMNFAQHSFDYENAIQHLDLAIITLLIIFVSKLIGVVSGRRALLAGIAFLATVLFVYAVRWWVEGYFERRSPQKYYINDNLAGYRYGSLFVVGSNVVVILAIIVIETVVLGAA